MIDRETPYAPAAAGTMPRIRAMADVDMTAVLTIERASFSSPWTRKMFLAELHDNAFSRFFVAELAGEGIVGYAGGWIILDELQVLSLAVRPECRRRGIARGLLTRLFRAGMGPMVKAGLEVRRSNGPAIAMYEGFGFRLAGVRPRYYREPTEDALIMQWMAEEGRGGGWQGFPESPERTKEVPDGQ